MGKRTNPYKILVGKPEGKRPFGRPRRRWENHIKTDHKDGVRVWTGCIWLMIPVAGSCEQGNETSSSTKKDGKILD
jgi:hypothetical protein